MDLKALGTWIRQNRRGKDLSQAELGQRVECAGSYISGLERAHPHNITGKPTRPDVELLDKMAELFGVSPNIPRRLAGYSDKEEDSDVPATEPEKEVISIMQSVAPAKRPALVKAFRNMADALNAA